MKIALVQLSDIHISSTSDLIFSRVEQIAAAATSLSNEISAYVILVTGDIANWGLASQYEAASIFFGELAKAISDRIPNDAEMSFTFVPGNHDCDFTTNKDVVEVREAVLEKIADGQLTAGLIKQCLSVQDNFFQFVADFGEQPEIEAKDRLCWIRKITVKGQTIFLQCFNTAWVSTIREKQGQLIYPVEVAREIISNDVKGGNLVVSLFHHPLNWLEQSNTRVLGTLLEQTSDVILTGHEHVEGSFLKIKPTGENVTYIAGGVLQEDSNPPTGFNVILIDFEVSQQQPIQFVWTDRAYHSRGSSEWVPFVRNRFLVSHGFVNNGPFGSFLQDLGTEYLHPYKLKGTISLDDLFVFPDITKYPSDPAVEKSKVVRSEDAAEEIVSKRYAVIYGEENSGKTTMSKWLYRCLQDKEFVPLLLKPGDGLSGHDDGSLRSCLDLAITNQYSPKLIDDYHQLPKKRKALIVDDIHKLGLNAESQSRLLATAERGFEIVIVFANDIYQYQSLVEGGAGASPLLSFATFKIRESGRKLRGQLIRRWLLLGREMIIDPKELSHEEHTLESALNATISKNVIPSYPFWIVSILQMWNSEKTRNGNYGAFGYIFEGLINKQLEDIGYDASKIDSINTFLGRLAYFLFEQDEQTFTYENLQAVNADYRSKFKVTLPLDDLLKKLKDARVLKETDGSFSFTQPYIFYFFVARYIKENLAAGKDVEHLKSKVCDMIAHIAYEPYSYILLIFVYLTKEYDFIQEIIAQARQIYRSITPADLSTDVEFLNKLSPEINPIQIESADINRNREEYRESIDEAEEIDEDLALLPEPSPLVRYSDDLNDLTKMIIATKTLDLMGQILRNFPGSLYGDIKTDLAKESYLLGLRTLQAFLNIAEEGFDEFRTYYSTVIKEKRERARERELNVAADKMVLWLTSGASFGMIKRVSSAVGHEDLAETYSEVKADLNGMDSVEMIDLSIKLDHFRGIPHAQIKAFAKRLKENKFTYSLLRDMISHFLFLFPVHEGDRQKLSAQFEISTPQNRLLLNDEKRSRRRRSKKRKQ